MKALVFAKTPASTTRRLFGAMVVLAALGSLDAGAGEWTLSGSGSVELRYFLEEPAYPGQLDGLQGSAILAPEWSWRSESRRHQVKVSPWARWDAEDDERSHGDLREAYYRYVGDAWEILAGVNRLFWGVTESRHLVDIVNQTDAVEDVDEEDKLGQPMLQLGLDRPWGRVEILALLGFRERTFAGPSGRLRPPLVVDTDSPIYESRAGDERVDWALRWSHFLGDWDLGAHLFHGHSREPRFQPRSDRRALLPVYDIVTQLGLDAQLTRGAWLWKLETIARETPAETFGAAVAGFEHTLYQLGGSAADLGLILELHWDDRGATAPPTIFDEDTFLGARWALNDIQDTSLLAGALIDHDDQSTAFFLEGQRRLGQRITLEIEGRFFLDVDPAGDLGFVSEDDHLTLRLAWNL